MCVLAAGSEWGIYDQFSIISLMEPTKYSAVVLSRMRWSKANGRFPLLTISKHSPNETLKTFIYTTLTNC